MEMLSTQLDDQKREERPRQAAQRTTERLNRAKHSTRDQRRAYLVSAMVGTPVVSLADYVGRLRTHLSAALLDENPDQAAGARAWGERAAS